MESVRDISWFGRNAAKARYDLHLVEPTSAFGMVAKCQQGMLDVATSVNVKE